MIIHASIGGRKRKGPQDNDDKKKPEEEQTAGAIFGVGNLGDDLTMAGEGHDDVEDEVK